MQVVDVTVSYLAMETPGQLRFAGTAPPSVELRRVVGPDVGSVAGALYRAVGAEWHWRDRLQWSDARWSEAVSRNDVEIWTAVRDGTVAGYFELGMIDGVVDIHYFGLMPEFIGQGIGRWLLAQAVDRAWTMGAARVTLNTCTLDGPAALPNYLSRGFEIVRTVAQRREIPA